MTDIPQSNRLDRIEQLLLLTTTALGETAKQQQANTQAIAQVTARLDQLTLKVDGLTDDVGLLTDYFQTVIANAESDREIFQSEIRRIWEYLLQRGGNGNGHTG
ncbi:hypothetical protein [Anabaena sp. CCY 9402-a]|uniref:hypothetical protein n=1 Tax=Anabaena sp. CCY 9402-a TaxID=3103867 RepID=UPI0039C5C409